MRIGIALLLVLLSVGGLVVPLWELLESGVLQELVSQFGASMLAVYLLGNGYFIAINVLPLRYRPKAMLNAVSLVLLLALIALGVIEKLHWIFALGAVLISIIGWRLLAIARLLRGYFKSMREYADIGDLENLNQALLRLSHQKASQSLWINICGYIITFRAFLHLVVPFKLAFDGDSLNLVRLQQQALELASRNMLSTLGDDYYGEIHSSKVRLDDHLEQDYLQLLDNMVQATAWFNRQKQRLSGERRSAGFNSGSMVSGGFADSVAASQLGRAFGSGAGATRDNGNNALDSALEGSYREEQQLDLEIDSRMAAYGHKVAASDKSVLKLVVKMLWALSAENPQSQRSAAPVKQRRLVDFEIGSAVMSFQGIWRLGLVRHNLTLLWPIACLFISLFSVWALLHPENVTMFFAYKQAFSDSVSLLEAYNLWFLLLLSVLVGGFLLMVGGIFMVGVDVSKYFAVLKLQVILCVFYVFIAGSLLISGNVVSLFLQVHSDLHQAQEGLAALQRSEVFLSPRVLVTNIGEPLSSEFQSVRRFRGFSTLAENQESFFLVPRDVWLPWDQMHVYQENRARTWNYDHARQYMLYHTSNLHLVLFAQQIQFPYEEHMAIENQSVPLRDSLVEPTHISRQALNDLIDKLRQDRNEPPKPQMPVEQMDRKKKEQKTLSPMRDAQADSYEMVPSPSHQNMTRVQPVTPFSQHSDVDATTGSTTQLWKRYEMPDPVIVLEHMRAQAEAGEQADEAEQAAHSASDAAERAADDVAKSAALQKAAAQAAAQVAADTKEQGQGVVPVESEAVVSQGRRNSGAASHRFMPKPPPAQPQQSQQ